MEKRRLKNMNLDEKADSFIGSFKKTMSITRKTIQNIQKQISSIEKGQKQMKKKIDQDLSPNSFNNLTNMMRNSGKINV